MTSWLEQYPYVKLVAHYRTKIDFAVLMASLFKMGLTEKCMYIVVVLMNSLRVFRKLYPMLELYKHNNLAHILLMENYFTHDVVHNAKANQTLICNEELSTSQVIIFTFPQAAVYNQ